MSQQKLALIHKKIREKKTSLKNLKDMHISCLENDKEYPGVLEKFKQLQEKKKAIEKRIENENQKDFETMDRIKKEIEGEKGKLSIIAVTSFVSGNPEEFEDEFGTKYLPVVKGTYKKV